MRAARFVITHVREKVSSLDIGERLNDCIQRVLREQHISEETRAALNALFRALKCLLDMLNTNSSNSSVPPSADPHRTKQEKKPRRKPSPRRRPGGQPGHSGSFLGHATPTDIIELKVDRSKIPSDRVLTSANPIRRQVYGIEITRKIVEYQAEVLVDQYGNRYTAEFPEHVRGYSQYDSSLKAYVTELSVRQMIPYERLAEHLKTMVGIPIATGTIRNCIEAAARKLELFKIWLKTMLVYAMVQYTDMTSINISGKQQYVSIYCSDKYTYIVPHEHKGIEPIEEVGIIPLLKEDQLLMHDCDPTYFRYTCQHATCGAHLLRDLKAVEDKDGLKWPSHMRKLLTDARLEKEKPSEERNSYRYYQQRYRSILTKGENETKKLKENQKLSDGGCLKKKTTSEVLLERLRKYENEYLTFIKRGDVEFTNNISERGLRPIKLRDKISGCVKNLPSAEDICLLMSYIKTCENNGIPAGESLKLLFEGKFPEFINFDAADPSLFIREGPEAENNEEVTETTLSQ